MDTDAHLKTLLSVVEPEGTIVTLSLDLAGAGMLPEATRMFLKDEVFENLASEARPPNARAVLKRIARRISTLVATGLEPATKGLYLVAGRGVWMPVELRVRTRNFLTTGPRAFLPPLLAAEAKNPSAYLVGLGSRGFEIRGFERGEGRLLVDRKAPAMSDDREHVRTGRSKMHQSSGSGGGAERDRRQQREIEAFRGLIRQAVSELRSLLTRHPAREILVAGPRDILGEFDRHLPSEWRGKAAYLGVMDDDLDGRALVHLQRSSAERAVAEILEFHERRAEGGQVALGPNDVLHALWSGRAARVYLDEFDPLPGVVCTGCGVHRPGLERRCPFCEEDVKATSLAQDIVGYSLSHKPAVGLTFVGSGVGWLKDLGGMAAILTTTGARSRRAAVLK